MQHVAIADQPDVLHDPDTFITKYIWSQDHKVIAIQYSCTAIFVGLVATANNGNAAINNQQLVVHAVVDAGKVVKILYLAHGSTAGPVRQRVVDAIVDARVLR